MIELESLQLYSLFPFYIFIYCVILVFELFSFHISLYCIFFLLLLMNVFPLCKNKKLTNLHSLVSLKKKIIIVTGHYIYTWIQIEINFIIYSLNSNVVKKDKIKNTTTMYSFQCPKKEKKFNLYNFYFL